MAAPPHCTSPSLTSGTLPKTPSHAKVAMLRFNSIWGKAPSTSSTPRKFKATTERRKAKSVMVKSLWSVLFYLCTADKSSYHYNPDPTRDQEPSLWKPPIPIKKTLLSPLPARNIARIRCRESPIAPYPHPEKDDSQKKEGIHE